MRDNKITFFACDNGDSTFIEAHDTLIMTDINYRSKAADTTDETNDFAPKIRKACLDDYLDVFVLTHPDADHLRGFNEIFHLGDPDKRDTDPDEGDVKILVNEIWCSEYAADPNYAEESKDLLNEIGRRKNLIGTPQGNKDGNRILILSATNGDLNVLKSGIEWRLLAPTIEEADIPISETENKNSSNPSSLVIQWNITVGGAVSKVLIGGDSTVEIWERIGSDFSADQIDWHILLAPHHCSRHSLGRGIKINGEDKFEWSDFAYEALANPISGINAYVVSSSRKFGTKTPPNPLARDKYHKILANGSEVTTSVKDRFLCTGGKGSEKPKDIEFKFTSSGPSKSVYIASVGILSSSSGQGGGYGKQ